MSKHSAAASNVGKVRASNQDAGYAGTYLSVVADGMGGHAGGDVASHLVIRHLLQLDKEYTDVIAAQQELLATLLQANDMLSDVVYEHPELAGLGTTVSAMLRVGRQVVIAHIGDSRIYLLREGNLSQVTVDHTFVQRLIDSGRITEEEAHDHPRRSVLMRVLGDVDASPELDTAVLDLEEGDRWMLCSDGLTGVVYTERLKPFLVEAETADDAADTLVQASLTGGAPDNVTVVVVDITADEPEKISELVGSAAGPMAVKAPEAKLIPTPNLKPRPKPKKLPVSTGGMSVPPTALTAQLDAVKAKRIRRRAVLIGSLILVVGAIVIAAILGYRWSQTQFYVGSDTDSVVIYQGIPEDVAGMDLSHVYVDTDIPLESLTAYQQQQIKNGIPFGSYNEAQSLVDSLTREAK
ncbi:MAG: PP2C family serine/threonine-protein phosphatase [Rhodoluna sp.]|jgi:protein phosphatase|uniref:PP2C family protein-serine/threonine phosphatase n=1 Tax=Aurantimicrobium minutum TaxID=708131 RepID=UPI0024754765|nr:protein phosphatase 2C domain-containing protein [Aurantimicrobium minutum]MDH6277884.1 serine/threonine protein phosphatase PrpC [Aurantimicrobium minutum]